MSDIFIIAICSVVAIHFLYNNIIFSFFSFSKKTTNKSQTQEPISIVVCAKNEEENIPKLLPKLLEQEYPTFEIILINDRSYDGTRELFQEFAEHHENVEVVNILDSEHFFGNKKYALAMGLKRTNYNKLLFIDADCYPNSKFWLQEMSNGFTQEKEIVLGYGAYEKIKGSFLNKLIRYETLLTAVQYFSYAKIGIPYMGVGRNLAYNKELYDEAGGFKKHIHIKSGDDDLLINQVATSKNTTITYSKESHTISKSNTSLSNWLHQKRRHITTARHYKWLHKILLGGYFLQKALFWFLIPFVFVFSFSQEQLLLIAGILSIKFIGEMVTMGLSAKKLNEKDLIWITPILDLILVIFQFYIFIRNCISKPKHW